MLLIRSILLGLGMVMLVTATNAEVLEVCKSCEINSVAEGIANSGKGDTILIRQGIYTAIDLVLDHPMTIIGETGATLDGQSEGYILKIMADSIRIRGLRLINAGKSYTKDYAAIYVFKSHHFSIRNNEIVNPFFGLLVEKSHQGEVVNNLIYGSSKREDDSGNGIHLWHCSNILVLDNEIMHLRDGIYLEFVTESQIINNHSHDNIRYGLHFMFSNHDDYLKNTFEQNGAGVAVMFSKFINMSDNIFRENWGTASYGLLLKEIYDAKIESNRFMNNTIGIFTEGSTRVQYLNNKFVSNGWAVKIAGACYTNNFSANIFLHNAFDMSYNSKLNDNLFDGNYWSSYTGYDLNEDGIGDVPFRPVKLFSYIVHQTPESIVLLRSLFIDLINFSEKVSPVFTPDDLMDRKPLMSYKP